MNSAIAPGHAAISAMPGRSRIRVRWSAVFGWSWVGLMVLFVYAPILVVIGASFDPGNYVQYRAYLQFPPRGVTLHWYANITPALWGAILASLQLAFTVAIGAVILGVAAALGLARGNVRFRGHLAQLFRTPLQIPFIVTAIAFLQAFGAFAEATGIVLQRSFTALFLAHLFVATPYVVSAAATALTTLSPRLDEAAASLGATRWRAFMRVTLPLIAPAVFGGAVFAFLISFTDVTIALFLAPHGSVTFPVWVYSSIQNDLETSLPAVSTLIFIASALIIVLLQKLIGMDAVLRGGGAKN